MTQVSHADVPTFLAEYNPLRWAQPDAPQTITPQGLYTAAPGVKVEVAYATAPAKPSAADARALWDKRWAKRPTGVLLVIAHPGSNGTTEATIVGLRDKGTFAAGLRLDQVERLVDQALEASSTATAEALLAPLFVERGEDEVPGFANTGLFATHELLTNVPNRPDWVAAGERAKTFRGHRGEDLIRALGWELSHQGIDVLLIKDGRSEAVAVFLEGAELFDRPATRFGAISPVQHAIAAARNARVRWVLAVQGSRVRLYTADPDTGIARKGSDTYTEIDLATIEDGDLGYATLLLTPEALCEGGTADEILAWSMDHAAALGGRLRDRVYVDVVPDLAKAVAEKLKATTETELLDAYHVTLVILFRLLFVAYAEDRGLLPYRTNDAYTRASLKGRARAFADLVSDGTVPEFDPVATDVWDNLANVWSGIYNGHREWGIPAYGGSLFDPAESTGATISGLTLTNAQIGPALVKLLVDTGRDATYGPVDFQTLSVREFGTIYEGLLESSLSLTPTNLTLDDGTYVPAKPGDDVAVYAGGVYHHDSSGQRKATGSYFTKQFAVEHLLETALDPTIDEHLARVAALLDAGDEAGAHEAFWDFRVADISMGSGHFLVGAVDHIASAFTAFLTDHPIPGVMAELERLRSTAFEKLTESRVEDLPEIDQMTLVRRQVAKRCIYGVDINTVAVDLARLALWIHTFVPGLPMSSLDHGLVWGNSLTGIGTLQEAFNAFEPESTGMRSFLADDLEDVLAEAAESLRRVGLTTEATAAETREAEEAYAEAVRQAEPAKAILDAAVAARLGHINLDGILDTDTVLRTGRRADVQERVAEVTALHLALAFPEVFVSRTGGPAGFHVLLGNPPWDEVMVEEPKFWQRFFPGVMGMKPAAQKRAIKQYRTERPDLVALHEAEQERAMQYRKALLAGPYPGLGTGDVDLYKAFAWRFWQLLRPGGRFGVVFPRSVLNAAGSAKWRETLLEEGTFASVVTLTNTGRWVFEEVHGQYTVTLLTVEKAQRADAEVRLAGPFHSLGDFRSGRTTLGALPAVGLSEWASGATFPLLPDTDAVRVFRTLRAHPRFDSGSQWLFKPVSEFHATNDRPTFDAGEAPGRWPVVTGATFNLWDPEAGDPYAYADPATVVKALFAKRKRQARLASSAFLGLDPKVVNDVNTLSCYRPRIAFRDVTNQTNSRTVLTALVPPSVVLTNTAPYLLQRRGDLTDEAYVLGILSSIPLDWYARRYVELHVNQHILNAFPMPQPDREDSRRLRVVEIAGRLAAIDSRYAAWAAEVGVPVGSANDPAVKDDLICELDAVVSHLYGLSREDVVHIFETFHRGWDFQPRLDGVLKHFDRWSQQ
ncbi:Eco57I restriction-modification methylase domain-containing protein [Georgenia muralis]